MIGEILQRGSSAVSALKALQGTLNTVFSLPQGSRTAILTNVATLMGSAEQFIPQELREEYPKAITVLNESVGILTSPSVKETDVKALAATLMLEPEVRMLLAEVKGYLQAQDYVCESCGYAGTTSNKH